MEQLNQLQPLTTLLLMIRVENSKLKQYDQVNFLKSAKIFRRLEMIFQGVLYVSVVNIVLVSFSKVCCSFSYLMAP